MMNRAQKYGFTLVEVLVVVIIMGVISTIGVSSFRQAVANSRVRDSAINVAAFLERVSMTARETNDVYCVVATANSNELKAYKGSGCSGTVVESMNLEGGVVFRSSSSLSTPKTGANTNLVGKNAYFQARIGLNSFRGSSLDQQTFEGYYLMQYASSKTWAGVSKVPTDNRFRSHTYVGAWRNL